MFKAPSKHGLDRKYKSWRKGKSANSKNRSSLKKQLRGYERVLQKKKSENSRDEAENIQELQQKIDALKQEIALKQQSLLEKKHAEKAHGQRFMDRQRLTRLEKQVRKLPKSQQGQQLFKIALDQVYVAHHPMDVRYMPLFKRGQRSVEYSRTLYRRAITRKRILRDLPQAERVPWIAADMYERLPPTEWSIQEEERVFGGSISRKGKNALKTTTEDSRFAVTDSKHEALLKAADQVESELIQEQEQEELCDNEKPSAKEDSSDDSDSSSSSSDSDSDDDDDQVDPVTTDQNQKNEQPTVGADSSSSDSGSSDSSSDSSDDEDDDDDDNNNNKDANAAQGKKRPLETAASKVPSSPPHFNNQDEVEEDDFLVDATDDAEHDKSLFHKSQAQEIPAWSSLRGDKSKGWQTQKQRPGEFKRRKKTWR